MATCKFHSSFNTCLFHRGKRFKARNLVRGDLIGLKIGDVIPADCILVGPNPLQSCEIDQAALTGESLPVIKHTHEKLLMGSVVKRGEQHAVVCATGPRTFFGKAAGMINSVESRGRFQVILFRVTLGLLSISLVMCTAMFIKLAVTHEDGSPQGGNKYLRAVSVIVVLLVASIPIAMQVVFTSIMAVGSRRLADKKVIVARLGAIEELAGMDILCSDKTGTLTKNKLELRPARMAPNADISESALYFYSGLASNKNMQQNDAIDNCICKKIMLEDHHMGGLAHEDTVHATATASSTAINVEHVKSDTSVASTALPDKPSAAWKQLGTFKELDFMPFNPTDKRVEVTCLPSVDSTAAPERKRMFRVTKGAPQIVLGLALHDPASLYTFEQARELEAQVSTDIQELADRGFRCLGVAYKEVLESETQPNEAELEKNKWGGWRFQGLLSLFDPPRDDTKETIAQALAAGVEVKMITGDQTAIAKETCRELGMGTNILDSHQLHGVSESGRQQLVMSCNGFAEVMPEDKFHIVESVRAAGHVVGMTGDGVNDAPALKRADIGIAVEGATDAAKAAADIVLTEPGLSVIIDAINRSRKIFQRMRNYCMYRIACTIELLLFFFVAVMFINTNSGAFFGAQPAGVCWEDDGCDGAKPLPTEEEQTAAHFNVFTLPVISLVVITILNDGTMITIAYDKVVPQQRPQSWNLWEVCIVAGVSGAVACLGSILLLIAVMQASPLHAGNWVAQLFGTTKNASGQLYVTFGEAQTLLYLKVALSDFLTVFSTRTRHWFFERRVGFSLGVAAAVAMGVSTILALFWPFSDSASNELNEAAYMAPLKDSKYGVLMVWVFCLVFFILQDAAKVFTYYALSLVNPEMEERLAGRAQQAKLGVEVSEMERSGRRMRVGRRLPKTVQFREGYTTVPVAEYEAMKARLAAVEQALVAAGVHLNQETPPVMSGSAAAGAE